MQNPMAEAYQKNRVFVAKAKIAFQQFWVKEPRHSKKNDEKCQESATFTVARVVPRARAWDRVRGTA